MRAGAITAAATTAAKRPVVMNAARKSAAGAKRQVRTRAARMSALGAAVVKMRIMTPRTRPHADGDMGAAAEEAAAKIGYKAAARGGQQSRVAAAKLNSGGQRRLLPAGLGIHHPQGKVRKHNFVAKISNFFFHISRKLRTVILGRRETHVVFHCSRCLRFCFLCKLDDSMPRCAAGLDARRAPNDRGVGYIWTKVGPSMTVRQNRASGDWQAPHITFSRTQFSKSAEARVQPVPPVTVSRSWWDVTRHSAVTSSATRLSVPGARAYRDKSLQRCCVLVTESKVTVQVT